jgi:hypothetical protein
MCGQGRPEENEYGVRMLAGRFSDGYLQRVSVTLSGRSPGTLGATMAAVGGCMGGGAAR